MQETPTCSKVAQDHVPAAFEYVQSSRFSNIFPLECEPSYLQMHVIFFSGCNPPCPAPPSIGADDFGGVYIFIPIKLIPL